MGFATKNRHTLRVNKFNVENTLNSMDLIHLKQSLNLFGNILQDVPSTILSPFINTFNDISSSLSVLVC